jgi:hypothetical protein
MSSLSKSVLIDFEKAGGRAKGPGQKGSLQEALAIDRDPPCLPGATL